MVENHETIVEADVAVRNFEVIRGPAGELWLDEILQIIAPITEATAERKWQIQFIEQLVSRHQALEEPPGISILDLCAECRNQLTARTPGAK